MEKLELKHLVGYLPYGAKIEDYEPKFTIFELKGHNIEYCIKYNLKPILRPLSDLTKDIEVNGEKFVPIESLYYLKPFECSYLEMQEHIIGLDIEETPYWLVQKLYEWHFDLHSLIEKNLAIDINNIK